MSKVNTKYYLLLWDKINEKFIYTIADTYRYKANLMKFLDKYSYRFDVKIIEPTQKDFVSWSVLVQAIK